MRQAPLICAAGDGDVIWRRAPAADLQPLVEAFAQRIARAPRAMFPVFPTARAELIFHFVDPFLAADEASSPMHALAPVSLLGPRMANYWQAAGPRIDWFMVQLTPLGCERLLGLRFADAWGRAVDVTEVWRGGISVLHDRLRAAGSFDARVKIATGALRRRLGDAADRLMRAGALVRSGRIRSIEALCARLDIGPRRLHQKFAAAYGVGPKVFLNLMRFGRQLERRHPGQLAPRDDVQVVEYNDDSHAIREFRRYAGMTPGAYTRLKLSGDHLVYTGAQIILDK